MDNSDHNNNHSSKKTLRRNSNSHISMSDTESTTSQVDSWHSPLRFESPLRSDDPFFHHENDNRSCKSIVPSPSAAKPNFPASSPAAKGWRMLVREAPAPVKKVVTGGGGGLVEDEEVGRSREAAVESIVRRAERGVAVKKGALVLRVFEMVACLVSFSVMAADRTQGWSGDSFDRYLEYRYCLAVNVIGFVYSGFQAYGLAYHLGTEKHVISHHLRYHFDFSMDQIVAYLLMSASSSAATRVTDWVSNWGKDEFTLKATASIAVSFLAFIAFSLSSLVSGYNLCNRDST